MSTTAATRRLRGGVIGAGKISEEHLAFLASDPHAHPAAVCDLSPALAEYAKDRFGVERHYTDYRRMLREVRPEVVHVLTPPHTHAAIVGDCLDAGADVIVEKPIAPTNAEFRAMWDRAKASGRRVMENQNYLFNDPFLAVRRAVDSGALGDVEEVDVRLALPMRARGGRYADENLPHPSHGLPGGVLQEYLTHVAYLALAFLPTCDRVTAVWSNHGGGSLFRFDDLDALVVGGTIHARLRVSARTSPDAFTLTVRGSRGWVETDFYQPYLRLVVPRLSGPLSSLANHFANGCSLIRSSVVNLRDKILYRKTYEGLHRLLGRSYAALAGGGALPIGFNDMDRASALIDALVREQGGL